MIQHQKQLVMNHIFFICFPKNKFKNTTNVFSNVRGQTTEIESNNGLFFHKIIKGN
jgi:hypothetical protein